MMTATRKTVAAAEQRLVDAALGSDPAVIEQARTDVLAARQALEDRKKLWLQLRVLQAEADQRFNEVDLGLELELKHAWAQEFKLLGEEERTRYLRSQYRLLPGIL